MRPAAVSAVLLLLLLLHVHDSLASLARSYCQQNYRPRSCRGGWVRLSGSQCVKYFALSKTFTQAESFCAGQGGHLASVHNSAENHHVFCLSLRSSKKSPTTNDHFWIGGSGKTSTSGYRWTDGSTFGFGKWFYGRPQHRSGHNCVVVNQGNWGDWNNADCDKPRNFVCVKSG